MNKQLTDLEVNTILAKFMGDNLSHVNCRCSDFNLLPYDADIWCPYEKKYGKKIKHANYTKSLDSLISVWEQLKGLCNFRVYWDICRNIDDEEYKFELINFTGSVTYSSNGRTLPQAAAHASALSVLELQSEVMSESYSSRI